MRHSQESTPLLIMPECVASQSKKARAEMEKDPAMVEMWSEFAHSVVPEKDEMFSQKDVHCKLVPQRAYALICPH